MKRTETTMKAIGDNTFYIRPFPAFTAANISGELVKMLSPVIGAIASAIGVSGSPKEAAAGVMDMDIDEVAPKLLIDNRNVSVEGDCTEGKTVVLTYDLANEVFCTDIQDMFVLCIEVIKVNFSGFFSKIAGQFGSLQGTSGETELNASAAST